MLHGCTIGDNSLIGIGAVILNGAVIGENCLIGAKALMPEGKDDPGQLAGHGRARQGRAPARGAPRRAGSAKAAEHYVANWQRYRRDLRTDEA